MKAVDLEKYKWAWRDESPFSRKNLTKEDIVRYLKSSSQSLEAYYKRSLTLDLVMKSVLMTALQVFIFIGENGQLQFIASAAAILAIIGIVWQVGVLVKIDSLLPVNPNLLQILKTQTSFYYGYYLGSVSVSALTGSLVFLAGSVYYWYFKYEEIPGLQSDDWLVLLTGALLSYGMGFFVQGRYARFRVSQLETCLEELEDGSMTKGSLEKQRNQQRKLSRLLIFAILAGVIIFLLLLWFRS